MNNTNYSSCFMWAVPCEVFLLEFTQRPNEKNLNNEIETMCAKGNSMYKVKRCSLQHTWLGTIYSKKKVLPLVFKSGLEAALSRTAFKNRRKGRGITMQSV